MEQFWEGPMDLWKFETARFAVTFTAEPEDLDPADSFQFKRDIKYAKSGKPHAWFCAVVTVTNKDTGAVLGRDVLGGCSYESFESFYQSHRTSLDRHRNTLANKASGVHFGFYFPDMIHEAVRHARANCGGLRRGS